MKTVLKIVVILLLVFTFLMVLEKIYTFGIVHNQNVKISNTAMVPKNAPVVFHGPCEPLWMISPALLDPITGTRSYNLALSHSDFADNYLHLLLYLENNKAPAILLLYVTPESLDKRFNTFNTYRFAPYLDDSTVAATVKDNDPVYYRWSRIPFMKYAYYNRFNTFEVIQGYRHFFGERKDAYYPDGFEPPTTRAWGNHAREFAELYEENIRFVVDPAREKYLIKIIDLAKRRGIRLILYESPVLAEAARAQVNREEIIKRIDELARHEGVSFVRFNLGMSRERKYFISALNFNMDGIRVFNDTLGAFIKNKVSGRN